MIGISLPQPLSTTSNPTFVGATFTTFAASAQRTVVIGWGGGAFTIGDNTFVSQVQLAGYGITVTTLQGDNWTFDPTGNFLPLSDNTWSIGRSGNALKGILSYGFTFAAAVAVSALPGSPVVGQMALVNNATVAVYGATVVGGGSLTLPVMYNGSNWITI